MSRKQLKKHIVLAGQSIISMTVRVKWPHALEVRILVPLLRPTISDIIEGVIYNTLDNEGGQ